MKLKLLLFALVMFGSSAAANAGILRHVVKPVVTKSASAIGKVAKTGAKVTKAVVY